MTKITDNLTTGIRLAMEAVKAGLIKEWNSQGHSLTGAAEQSMQYEIKVEGNTAIATMYANDYVLHLETGVRADRIPYSGRTGRGGKSKYIQGLIHFFELRGVHGESATRAAFATAATHRKSGLPSRGSYAFSANGRRTGFVRHTIDQYLPKITEIIGRETGAIVDITIGDTITLEAYRVAI